MSQSPVSLYCMCIGMSAGRAGAAGAGSGAGTAGPGASGCGAAPGASVFVTTGGGVATFARGGVPVFAAPVFAAPEGASAEGGREGLRGRGPVLSDSAGSVAAVQAVI